MFDLVNTLGDTCGENCSSVGEGLVQMTLQCRLKMVYGVANPSKWVQRVMIRLLRVDGCRPTEIYRCMYAIYGAVCVMKRLVMDWLNMF
jgi:hypothetical protein